MKNKINLKRVLIASVIVLIIFSTSILIVNYVEYQNYTNNFNNKIELILSKIIREYPNVEKSELIELLNNEDTLLDENNILKHYGIDIKKDSAILKNEGEFVKFEILLLILLILLIINILIIIIKYSNNNSKKINEITKYIEQINRRNYKLDIEENSEDELSILKNEIYKTTVMLNEIAENETKDKKELKESLSDISHQLKTPLTSIIIMLDNILDNKEMSQEVREEFIKDIKREITNIQFLIETLLKLSKLDANSVEFINKEVEVEEIIQNAVKNVAMICDLKNIKINITGNSKKKLLCDERWQIEAITNILKNAVEHSKNNSQIDIKYTQNKAYTKITIEDYGMGINEDDLKHIFERFYKGKNASKDSVGIGLALAKAIIEKNNGYITVSSKESEGTTFAIKYSTL
mgnify:FL=1